MFSPIQRLSPPRSGPSHSNRLSRWLSRLLHRTTTNLSTTKPVEVQQQQSTSEQSASDIISSEDNTTITPGSLFRRRPDPSFWRRVIRRARQGRRRNLRLDSDEVDPHRGFSPPRHRQRPDWMRQWRDDGGDRVSESSESGKYGGDRRIKESGGETSVRKNEGSEGGIIGVGVGTE